MRSAVAVGGREIGAPRSGSFEPAAVEVPDVLVPRRAWSLAGRSALAVGSLACGAAWGAAADPSPWALLIVLAFVGGLLSTWSPCGYSSLATLRPWGRWSIRAVAGWLPTLLAHGAGYVAGGLLLGSALALGTLVLSPPAGASWPVLAIALVSLAYGLDQLGLLSLPYPQRKSQVPHDVRFRWPMWRIGLLYGFALGLNFVTYVRTPILYVVVLAALLSGSWVTSLALVLALNAGRFLPLLVNALPVTDRAVQAWLARHEERAVLAGGAAQLALGAAIVATLADL
jgi:cytochrome c biogenesis protein CcdA